MDGLIADVALVGPNGAGFAEIADEAGCVLVENDAPAKGVAQALAGARQSNVFLFLAGHAIDRGFIEEAHDAIAFGGLKAGRVCCGRRPTACLYLVGAERRAAGRPAHAQGSDQPWPKRRT